MFCGSCGAKVNDDLLYCPKCGAKLIKIGGNSQPVIENQAAEISDEEEKVSIAERLASKINVGLILAVVCMVISILTFMKPWVRLGEYAEDELSVKLAKVSKEQYESEARQFTNLFRDFPNAKLPEASAIRQMKVIAKVSRDGKFTPYELLEVAKVASDFVNLADKGIQREIKDYENNPSYEIDYETADTVHKYALILKIGYYAATAIYYLTFAAILYAVWTLIRQRRFAGGPYMICILLFFALTFAAVMLFRQYYDEFPEYLSMITEYTDEIRLTLLAWVSVITAVLSTVLKRVQLRPAEDYEPED